MFTVKEISTKYFGVKFRNGVCLTAALGMVGAILLHRPILWYATHGHVTASVNKTESIGTQDGIQKRVYTDKGVFTVNDCKWYFRFRSADTFGEIHEGRTYDFEKCWFRFGLTSSFPNILSAREIKTSAGK